MLLVCFDEHHRIALVRCGPSGAGCPWALPAVQRRAAESYDRAAGRLTRLLAPAGAIRLGAVTGRTRPLASDSAARRRPVERRVFTGHVTVPGALSEARVLLTWVPYGQVAEQAAEVGIAELGLFVEGYVAGWIPDGWITLD